MRKLAALLAAVPLAASAQQSAPPAADVPPPQYAPPAPQQYAPPPQPYVPQPYVPQPYVPQPYVPQPYVPPAYVPPAPAAYVPPEPQASTPQQQYAPPQQQPPPPQYAPPDQPQYAPQQYAPPPQYAPPAQYTPPLYARRPQTRSSWYIGFGLGSGDGRASGQGSSVSFKDMHGGRDPANLSFNFKVGFTASPHLLLGLDLTELVSVADSDGLTTSVGVANVDAVVTLFPAERGFFLRAGVGRSALTYKVDDPYYGEQTWNAGGFNALGGVGYAFWLGRTFNLTLNVDFSKQWYDSSDLNPEDSSFWAAYVGFDWY